MAEEFQTEVCGWNWWNSSRNSFIACSSPCSAGSFGWGTEILDIKTRSYDAFQDVQKPLQEDSASFLIDSSLQIMGFGVSSPSSTATDWNQAFLEKGENNLSSVLGKDVNSRLNYRQENSATEDFKPMNQDFSLEQQRLNPITSSSGFPIESASYGSPSTLIHSLFDTYPQSQPQQSLLNNRSRNNYCSMENYGTNSGDQLWHFPRTSLPKQQPNSLHFSNNTPFWNASAAAQTDIRHSFLPSSQSQIHDSTFEEKPRCTNFTSKVNKAEEVRDSKSMVKKSSIEPTFKRARIETPSPLPTFKVRKEKLGDRVTALQQLVSPFGKTDTASVLHEAIEYIKFLHDQASVLSTPYKKNGAPVQQQQQASDNFRKDADGPKQDLKSRGLCLVPISITFPVVNETSAEFWTPTFGGTFS